VHDRFQDWVQQGVFAAFWQAGLADFGAQIGIDWQWQMMDSAIIKAPLGEKATGANPTEREPSLAANPVCSPMVVAFP
jgi:hypothetical protein